MKEFEFVCPGRIVVGAGTVRRLGEADLQLGRRALLVTGADATRALRALEGLGLELRVFSVGREPELGDIAAGMEVARRAGCDWVIGMGGGAALDAGKAIAAMLAQPHDLLRYLEVIGEGRPLDEASLPYVAVPTTAGTGAEATKNAVIRSVGAGVKASLRHATMVPRVAVIDPELALSVPAEVTAATGMDALTQLLEAFVCTRAQPMTDGLCREGILRAGGALRRVVRDGNDLEARAEMAVAALHSGLALANAGLGAVHGFAAPLGGRHGISHGVVCATLLPAVWEVNLRAVEEQGGAGMRRRFVKVARWLTGDRDAKAEDAVAWLRQLREELRIPGLRALGVKAEDWDELIPLAERASSMKANPVRLSAGQLAECLELAG